MTRKTTRRRHYALVNPLLHAMEGAAITPRHLLDRLKLAELSALDDFTRGRATVASWHAITSANNLCETMARGDVGHEALEACAKVEDAMIEAYDRFQRNGKMGLTGPGVQAVRDMLEYHDLQRASISRGEYENFIQRTQNVIASGLNVNKLEKVK